MPPQVQVTGLKEIYRDFRRISEDLTGEVEKGLIEAAKPVADLAEQLALGHIRNMPKSPEWAEYRIGISKREALVYMVPEKRATRRKGRKREKFAPLLASRSMDPALEQREQEVIEKLEDVLDDLSREHHF